MNGRVGGENIFSKFGKFSKILNIFSRIHPPKHPFAFIP